MKKKRIDLNNGFVIDVEDSVFVLKNNLRKSINKKGEEVEKFNLLGYYGNYATCFNKILKEKYLANLKDHNTIKEAFEILKQTKKEIDDLMQEIGI